MAPRASRSVQQKKSASSASSSDDLDFGISYKPVKKSYELPSGPAFADEAEFERELDEDAFTKSSTGGAAANDENEDDEFDFDGDGDGDEAVPRINNVQPLTKSIPTSNDNEESEEAIIEQLKAEVRATQLSVEGVSAETGLRDQVSERSER